MQWIEVSIQTTHAANEAVADIFHSLGAGGVVIEDPLLLNNLISSGNWELCAIPEQENTEIVVVTAYFPDDHELKHRLTAVETEMAAMEARVGPCRFGNTCFRTVSETDWENEWKQYFHVARVTEQLIIKPSWEEYQAGPEDKVIELDPGMAFGTGTHHTTCMCLRRLEKIIEPGMMVYDVGTGSGILSLAAAKFGAEKVTAIDIDETAVKIAKQNVANNGLAKVIEVRKGDLLQAVSEPADVVIANIIADVIISFLPAVPLRLKQNGVFLASGIIAERVDEVIAAAKEQNLLVETIDSQGGWVVIQMRKEE
ncbi:MAG TPA: 50S ribosomal protein L11 methyltransferase [Candidatus Avacidaminococcus intestinavium]|uniref:Ribosomal protein L11 methyltransferase n=1 Tax=Candidatus Avacidaminococcus intestinavium TaxID=2840684 RepID=A0A9D1SL02_9FIRM|nr:50S ribosomal protein L11 methyltransferase [Candidatus Avacidaminococcus intestinavium]